MKKIYAKINKNPDSDILAACDKELAGKTLKENEISFEVKERFYKEKSVSEKELEELLEKYGNINLVGKKTVSIALKKGLVLEKDVKYIEGNPHIQIYKI